MQSLRPDRPVGAAAAVLALFAALPAQAQDGGNTLSFSLSQSLETTRNLALTPGGTDLTSQAVTGLAFSYDTATYGQSFSLDVSGNLRAVDPAGSNTVSANFDTPRVAIAYAHSAPSASLDLSASVTQSDIAYLRSLEDFLNGNGVFPEDLADLQGTGKRRNIDAAARLSLFDDARFGLNFSAELHDIDYRKVTDPTLTDSSRLILGAGARLDLSEVAQLNLGLSRTQIRTPGADPDRRLTLSSELEIERPDGSFGLGLSTTDTGSGWQYDAEVSRSFTLPDGTLSGRLGATLRADDTLVATGALSYSRTGPQSLFSVDASREVTFDATNADVVQTALSVGFTHTLSSRLSGSLNAGLVREDDGVTATDLADLSAGLNYALTPETDLSARASWQYRNETPGTSADSLSLSLLLTRSWNARK